MLHFPHMLHLICKHFKLWISKYMSGAKLRNLLYQMLTCCALLTWLMLHRVSISNQPVEMVAHLTCPLSLKKEKKRVPADSSLVLYAWTYLSLNHILKTVTQATWQDGFYIAIEAHKLTNCPQSVTVSLHLLEKHQALPHNGHHTLNISVSEAWSGGRNEK